MRAPRPRGTPVDQLRLRAWLEDFSGYRYAVNEGRIQAWLGQFEARHLDAAARVLDIVEYFGAERISAAFRQSLGSLPGWHRDANQRSGKWRFAAMSQSAGESGDSMLHQFRIANRLRDRRHNELFVRPSELTNQELGARDTIVLLDDFVGTGKQVSEAWNSAFSQLVAECGTVYLIVVGAYRAGFDRIQEDTDLQLVASHRFNEADNFFSNQCNHFSPEEKTAIRAYCERANRQQPAGFGDCGLVVVFSHGCPNDSLPVLHADHPRWRGLFPRD